MITEAKFKYALKEMMAELPIEDINVTALCQKCGCHRQTFYYHYQDIYDLIAAIFLNENLAELESARSTIEALKAFVHYVKGNFTFLRATYNSAARDLTDDFIFNKLNTKFVYLWSADPSIDIKRDGCRNAARRFAHIIADEFGHCFRDPKLTPEKCSRKMNKFMDNAATILLPQIMALSKKEEGK